MKFGKRKTGQVDDRINTRKNFQREMALYERQTECYEDVSDTQTHSLTAVPLSEHAMQNPISRQPKREAPPRQPGTDTKYQRYHKPLRQRPATEPVSKEAYRGRSDKSRLEQRNDRANLILQNAEKYGGLKIRTIEDRVLDGDQSGVFPKSRSHR